MYTSAVTQVEPRVELADHLGDGGTDQRRDARGRLGHHRYQVLLNSNTSVNGPCEQNFVVYAPRSDVTLNSNSKFCGAIAGKSVHLDANAEIWSASGSEEFSLPG